MSSLSPPARKLWWNEPIHKSELLWISLVFVWGLIMTFMMPYWHVVGKQNLATETYKTTPKAFQATTEASANPRHLGGNFFLGQTGNLGRYAAGVGRGLHGTIDQNRIAADVGIHVDRFHGRVG